MDEPETEHGLTDDKYSALCELARSGQTKRLKKFLLEKAGNEIVGSQIFSADSASPNVLRRVSPFSLAARFGRVDTVKFFLQQFPHSIKLNPGASEYREDPRLRKELRHDLPLYWACLNGQLEVAKLLVSAGAMVDLPNCMQASPLQAAASNGHVKVMEFLVGKGADVNTTDMFGYSPLLAAVLGGHLKAVQYLLGKKAAVSQRTFEGYSVMHVAAEAGHVTVVEFLLESGISPMFDKATAKSEKYTPCPLFLAAASGLEVTAPLMLHSECTIEFREEAISLLCVGSRWGNLRDWTQRLPSGVQRNDNPEECFEILERSLGAGHRLITELWLREEELEFASLSEKVLQDAVRMWREEVKRSVYRQSYQVQSLLETYLQKIIRRCRRYMYEYQTFVIADKLLLQLYQIMNTSLDVLEILQILRAKHRCEADGNLQTVFSTLLFLMLVWLQREHAAVLNHRENSATTRAGVPKVCTDRECDEIGRKLVGEHLFFTEGKTLLHLALSTVPDKIKKDSWGVLYSVSTIDSVRLVFDLGLLVTALLQWGADAAIDTPDWNGERPLHLAVKLANTTTMDVIAPLVKLGVHLDYVNRKGWTALDICKRKEARELLTPSGPLPLSCLTCHVIIDSQIPYEALAIPPRIKGVIASHHRKSFFSSR